MVDSPILSVMPSLLAAAEKPIGSIASSGFPYASDNKSRSTIDKAPPPSDLSNGDLAVKRSDLPNGNAHLTSLPNGQHRNPNGDAPSQQNMGKRTSSSVAAAPSHQPADFLGADRPASTTTTMTKTDDASMLARNSRDDGRFAAKENGDESTNVISRTTHVKLQAAAPSGDSMQDQIVDSPTTMVSEGDFPQPPNANRTPSTYPPTQESLRVPTSTHRLSSPPTLPPSMQTSPAPNGARLQQRHTLEVPRLAQVQRMSKEFPASGSSDDAAFATGRFSPLNTPTRRRASMTLTRRATRSIHSDVHLDEVQPDEEATRWAEHIRQKRASRRKKEEEDDDRVVVGTKVDQNHVNWITAYNMLTGIRFTVSRTNAKMDRELTDADFEARHKFSFDITGNELTPSAKYDFKFKDYAPWVFRHLRQIFQRDPADYLMSLTSKYILSELTSPGKSGSFFYYSRDYRYIIKTIHHAEHKFLRRILRDYYNHVKDNPNTLLSQFYGLHRVKIPYGRKIHFVVMNNLFPPHRDIHMTFDLKGSTIGRDFREEDLDKNPRATLKDLNWLRRERHLEFGPTKKQAFLDQIQRDVKLLQRLQIMDYSMLIGIHDLEKGNQDNIRDKTLKVFQPGGEHAEDPVQQNILQRTPSKLENARKAKELRQIIKNQKPIPMDQTANKMPDEVEEVRKNFYFYSDDGGFGATHEDNTPGEEIYYLGIIDCLTHYSLIKRLEHFFKGLTNNESQISAIPPERYGDRFLHFISGIAMSKEAAERQKAEKAEEQRQQELHVDSDIHPVRTPTDVVMEEAEHQAEKSRQRGKSEEDVPNRKVTTVRSPSAERGEIGHTLPVVEEDAEQNSLGGRSGKSGSNGDATAAPAMLSPPQEYQHGPGQKPPPTPPKDSAREWGHTNGDRPPTPPKDTFRRNPDGPPTPPKDEKYRRSQEHVDGLSIGSVH